MAHDTYAAILKRDDGAAILAGIAYADDAWPIARAVADILSHRGAVDSVTVAHLWRRHAATARLITRRIIDDAVTAATVTDDDEHAMADYVTRRLTGVTAPHRWASTADGAPVGPYGRRAATRDAETAAPWWSDTPRGSITTPTRTTLTNAVLGAIDADGAVQRADVHREESTRAMVRADQWDTIMAAPNADAAERALRKVTPPRSGRRAADASRRAYLAEYDDGRAVRLIRETPLLRFDDDGNALGLLAAAERLHSHHADDGATAGRTEYGGAIHDTVARDVFRDVFGARLTPFAIGGRKGSARRTIGAAVRAVRDTPYADHHARLWGAVSGAEDDAACYGHDAELHAATVAATTPDTPEHERAAVAAAAATTNAAIASRWADTFHRAAVIYATACDGGRRPFTLGAAIVAATYATSDRGEVLTTTSDADAAAKLAGGAVDYAAILAMLGVMPSDGGAVADVHTAALRAIVRDAATVAYHAAATWRPTTPGADAYAATVAGMAQRARAANARRRRDHAATTAYAAMAAAIVHAADAATAPTYTPSDVPATPTYARAFVTTVARAAVGAAVVAALTA